MPFVIKTLSSRQRGTTTTELAMLVPILFTVFFAVMQIVVTMQSANATQYAAFMAARAYQVYGQEELSDINYRRLAGSPFTNADQTISEAVAEKIIMESLMWEHPNIDVEGGRFSLNRYYNDGNDKSVNGGGNSADRGAIRVNFLTDRENVYQLDGVEVTYCMPAFRGASPLFELAKEENPCSKDRGRKPYHGIAITRSVRLGSDPEMNP